MNESLLLDALKETDLSISRAMHVTLDNRWNFTTAGASFSRLYYVTKGGGFLQTADQSVEMTAGNVYFIPAGCAFSCGCEYMEKVFFHITVSTPEKYELSFSPCRIYSLPCRGDKLETLKELMNTREHLGVLRLRLLLLETLTELFDRFPLERSEFKNASPLVRGILSYIEENLSIGLTAADIAGAFYLSESKIRGDFRKELDIPLGKYIDDMVFLKARQMLSDPQASIAQVGATLGFCDQFYFSRRFKQRFGVTPSKYKRQNTAY